MVIADEPDKGYFATRHHPIQYLYVFASFARQTRDEQLRKFQCIDTLSLDGA